MNEIQAPAIPVNLDPKDPNFGYRLVELAKQVQKKQNEYEKRIHALEEIVQPTRSEI